MSKTVNGSGGGTPPSNTVAPVISGSSDIGSTLTSTTGTWIGDPVITYSYQWKQNGNDIVGETSSTYVIVSADYLKSITCEVTATNPAGFASAVSNSIIATATAPVNTVAPVISGTNVVGSTLSSTTGTWTGTPTPTYTYQWKRNGSNIASATSSTYTLVQADATFAITCAVTATNVAGSAEATSNALTIIDADAQAFFTASGLTGTTNQSAINQLVVDMKGYGIWTKMKAIYPMVGGTAALHKWNLKDPQDTNAAFRLVFSGGWTHSSTGALPNGTNGFANTYLSPLTNLTLNSTHLSYYSRNNVNLTQVEIGCNDNTGAYTIIEARTANVSYFLTNTSTITGVSDSNSAAFYIGNRTASNVTNGFRNNIKIFNSTLASTFRPSNNIYIGAVNNSSSIAQYFSTKECAFASIGDGLTDTDAANFYTAVQAYQTTLGRSIGPQTVSDPDAQAFVTAANIEDQVQAQAVNQLTIDMKAANIWTKMKAIYPFVGGTASSHKFNLKNPLDTNAAFRLTFNGGWTHTAQGAQANGTNGYADTFFVPSAQYAVDNNHHISIYSRLNQSQNDVELGNYDGTRALQLRVFYNPGSGAITEFYSNNLAPVTPSDANSLGNYIANRIGTAVKIFKNNTTLGSFTNSANGRPTISLFLANSNNLGSPNAGLYSNKQYAFSSIGDGLTDTEAGNFYTMVQTFNTTLNRQV